MELIEDLGVLEYGNAGKKRKFGLYKCPVCGEAFKCLEYSIKTGHTTKCRKCADKARGVNRTIKAADDFAGVCTIIHGGVYDYSLVLYKNSHTPVQIICKEHGVFEQAPNNHRAGKGCPLCNSQYLKAKDSFILDAVKVHSDTYVYDLVVYNGCDTPVQIICKEHGVFEQTPNTHKSGSGCPTCAKIRTGERLISLASEKFALQASSTHKNFYDYSLSEYLGSHIPIAIVCPDHGVFYQKPNHHLSGHGCSSCATNGFDKGKPATLYYVKISTSTTVVYKIGITNRTIQERFTQAEWLAISVLNYWEYQNGEDAYTKEQEIIKQYKEFKYIGAPILNSGNTELFVTDILNMEKVT